MRRKINGEAYLIIKKNYTLIIRNSNSAGKDNTINRTNNYYKL